MQPLTLTIRGMSCGHCVARVTKSLGALDGLEIDISSRTADLEGKPVSLTPREFDLLATFARFPNVVLDREHLLDLVWGTSFYALRTVDVHVARLREKLKGSKLRIETVWGSGYRLAVE